MEFFVVLYDIRITSRLDLGIRMKSNTVRLRITLISVCICCIFCFQENRVYLIAPAQQLKRSSRLHYQNKTSYIPKDSERSKRRLHLKGESQFNVPFPVIGVGILMLYILAFPALLSFSKVFNSSVFALGVLATFITWLGNRALLRDDLIERVSKITRKSFEYLLENISTAIAHLERRWNETGNRNESINSSHEKNYNVTR